MATFKVLYKASTKTAYVLPTAQANIAGTTNIGTFDHEADPDDELGLDINHVTYHHVRDLLYAIGEQDMQSVSIMTAVNSIVLEPSILTIILADAKPYQLIWTLNPNDTPDKDVTFVSSDPTKATVSADGVVTGVAEGETTITITHTLTSLTDTCVVTVEA